MTGCQGRSADPADVRPPEVLVIGAMKCGTSALHRTLDAHPDVAMAAGKELNFFFGPDVAPPGVPADEWWIHGQWHRGPQWYDAQLDSDAPVRGESSPGYTDPAHPEVAGRVHRLAPGARLVYLVREPFTRALSQWRHHRRDGAEPRPAAEALLDEGSQYVARSRYLERVTPFRELFDDDRLLVVVQERLRADPVATLRRIDRHLGVDPDRRPAPVPPADEVGPDHTRTAADAEPVLRRAFRERVDDDVAALRAWLDDDLPEWDG